MVRLGVNLVSIYPQTGIMIENNGTIIFKGNCCIGNDSYISVGCNSTVTFGDKFTATASFKLASHSHITFDDMVSVGWNCLFIDSDFHRLTREDRYEVNPLGKIKIGKNVWFGNNCIILKKTLIPDFTTIAACTLVNQNVVVPEKTIIGNPRSISVLQTGVWRDFNNDKI